jgi:hypothetical protein
MTKDKLLQQALDALGPAAPTCCGCTSEWEIAITAIKEALLLPQRKWVELTWGDVPENKIGIMDFVSGARWASQQLKEKNL